MKHLLTLAFLFSTTTSVYANNFVQSSQLEIIIDLPTTSQIKSMKMETIFNALKDCFESGYQLCALEYSIVKWGQNVDWKIISKAIIRSVDELPFTPVQNNKIYLKTASLYPLVVDELAMAIKQCRQDKNQFCVFVVRTSGGYSLQGLSLGSPF